MITRSIRADPSPATVTVCSFTSFTGVTSILESLTGQADARAHRGSPGRGWDEEAGRGRRAQTTILAALTVFLLGAGIWHAAATKPGGGSARAAPDGASATAASASAPARAAAPTTVAPTAVAPTAAAPA